MITRKGNQLFVIESEPSGMGSINNAIKWLDDLKSKADDMRPVWLGMTPDIKKSIKHEFSHSNPNKWRPLSKSYKQWKIDEGLPTTIGFRTGELMRGLTETPEVDYRTKSFSWGVDSSVEHASEFNERRKIFITTFEFIASLSRRSVDLFVKRITEDK